MNERNETGKFAEALREELAHLAHDESGAPVDQEKRDDLWKELQKLVTKTSVDGV